MSTYNLYPGLKRILEDKRIKSFGVPEEHHKDYLSAEQFFLDTRGLDREEIDDIHATYGDLALLNLNLLPVNNLVLHVLYEAVAGPNILTMFSPRANEGVIANEKSLCYLLCENSEEMKALEDIFKEDSNHERFARHCFEQLIVMLATKGAIKEKHEIRKSQKGLEANPHKKGSGGYTIVRPPRAYELSDNLTGRTVRPHFRRGHIRKLHPEDKTKWIWVSSCFIHGEPEVQRTAYLVA